VADHLTEEEQIETIKRWWSENWLSLVLPIVIAIAGYSGWNFWQQQKLDASHNASDQYQTLLSFVEKPELSESERGQAILLAQSIDENYSSSLYADLSALIAAKLAVDSDDLDLAESTLRGVVDDAKTPSTADIAKARLAQVLLAKEKTDEALQLVASTDSDAMKALYAEIRGDALIAKGNNAAAKTAYEEALSSLLPEQSGYAAIIQFKMQGVSQELVAQVSETAVSEAATASQGEEQAEAQADSDVQEN